MEGSKSVLHDLDLLDTIRDSITNRYHAQKDNHTLNPVIKHLYSIVPKLNEYSKVANKKYGLSSICVNIPDDVYHKAKVQLAKNNVSISQYMRQVTIHAIKHGISKDTLNDIDNNTSAFNRILPDQKLTLRQMAKKCHDCINIINSHTVQVIGAPKYLDLFRTHFHSYLKLLKAHTNLLIIFKSTDNKES